MMMVVMMMHYIYIRVRKPLALKILVSAAH